MRSCLVAWHGSVCGNVRIVQAIVRKFKCFLYFRTQRLFTHQTRHFVEHRFRMCEWAPRWTACVTHGHRRATQTRRVRGTWSGPNRLRLGRRRCVASTQRADVLLHKSLVRSIIATTVLFVDPRLLVRGVLVYSYLYSCALVYSYSYSRILFVF